MHSKCILKAKKKHCENGYLEKYLSFFLPETDNEVCKNAKRRTLYSYKKLVKKNMT